MPLVINRRHILRSKKGFVILRLHKCQGIAMLPYGFSYIEHSNIQIELKFCTYQNFVGKPLPGYHHNVGIAKSEVCRALYRVADNLAKEGYGLVIYDAYRPMEAQKYLYDVWLGAPLEVNLQTMYYPDYDKRTLYDSFIEEDASHNSGRSVAVGLTQGWAKKKVDMGCAYGVYEEHVAFRGNLEASKVKMREKLRNAMKQSAFYNKYTAWWKFDFHPPELSKATENQEMRKIYNFPVVYTQSCCGCLWSLFSRSAWQSITQAQIKESSVNRNMSTYNPLGNVDKESHDASYDSGEESDSSFEPVI